MGRELFVRHISEKATEDDLRRLFGVVGRVVSVRLLMDPETGRFKGCGFVKMGSDAEAREAITTLDDALLIDRVISVCEARPQEKKGDKSPAYKGAGGANGRPRRQRK
ncbi:MAG TPA: RNA-binding protein [Geobacteraceae bacterium]